jgi:branched-chain amino acid transport system substrate-binding protein
MKKNIGIFFAILLVFALMTGTVFAEQGKFGVAVPLTGPYAAQAQDMKNGSLMALDEINAAGGVLGQPAKLIVRDSELKGSVALRRFKEMVAEENLSVIGGNLSGSISLVANEYACKNNLVYMSYCHTSLPVGKEFCGNGFTGAVIPYQTAAALSQFVFKNLGKTFMTLTADYRWGHDNLASWIHNSEKYGGKFLGNIYAPLGTRDYSAFIPQILAKKPDILVVSNYGTDQTSAIKQFAEMGLTKRMKIVISKTHLISIKECGATYDENVYGAVTYYWKLQDKYPQGKPFVKKFWDTYGAPPSADGECAYVATKAIFQAMNLAGTVNDVPKIISTLEAMQLDTPKGVNRFRPCDHPREQSIVILRGKGAKASGWDVADVVTEVPASQTLESCYNNSKDIPYGAAIKRLAK